MPTQPAHSTETTNPDGTKNHDLTSTGKSLSSTPHPVKLGDANASAHMRAVFFAAIIAGALCKSDLEKTAFASAINESYAADFAAGALDPHSRSELRKQLSKQAYTRVREMLPTSGQSQFDEIFPQSGFLFALSVTSDSVSTRKETSSNYRAG